jgi:hypothetical protein
LWICSAIRHVPVTAAEPAVADEALLGIQTRRSDSLALINRRSSDDQLERSVVPW